MLWYDETGKEKKLDIYEITTMFGRFNQIHDKLIVDLHKYIEKLFPS